MPEIAFSAIIINAVTRTFGCKSSRAVSVARIAADPAMSLFIAIMVSYGRFNEMPPVSKVMPLPTKTTWGNALTDFFFDFGWYETSIIRGPGLGEDPPTARNPPNSLSSAPPRIFTVKPVPFA